METDDDTGAFFDPDLTPEAFREVGYRTVDLMTEYFETVRDEPVYPTVSHAELEAVFDEDPPEEGVDPDEVLDAWEERVLPYVTRTGSPRFFGFVMGSGTMLGALADALAATTNTNAGGWAGGPSGEVLEERTIEWLADAIGYPTECGGLFTSGGTMANFTAILTGLRNTAPYDTTPEGLQSAERPGRFTLYMADHEGHSSVVRVADMLNLGRDAVRLVPSNDDFTMDVDALDRLLDEDESEGKIPFCVVAQAGSINVGAVDPLSDLADLCERRGLWFHVDGACGAVGAILPEKRHLYGGLDRADSVTLDPHKWLYVPYECGCALVREPEHLRRTYSMSAPYLRDADADDHHGSYFDSGPQMSRGLRALKVWMSLKQYGLSGYRRLLRQNVACVEHLDARVRAHPDFEALHEPTLFIYSFRYAPAALQGSPDDSHVDAYLDDLQESIVDAVQESGLAYLTTTDVRGRAALRMSVCSHRTTTDDIDLTFEALAEHGARIDGARRSTDDPSSPAFDS
jgi:glutamate/tyrosine decarboxylase-like PLP-dependent enzyme